MIHHMITLKGMDIKKIREYMKQGLDLKEFDRIFMKKETHNAADYEQTMLINGIHQDDLINHIDGDIWGGSEVNLQFNYDHPTASYYRYTGTIPYMSAMDKYMREGKL